MIGANVLFCRLPTKAPVEMFSRRRGVKKKKKNIDKTFILERNNPDFKPLNRIVDSYR